MAVRRGGPSGPPGRGPSAQARWALIVLLALVAPGCLVTTLHPLYDEASVVFDAALLGSWQNRESEVRVTITRAEWRSYAIAYTDRTGTTHLTGFLTDIGATRFLNVRPEDGLERPAFLVAANGMMQIAIEPTQIRVREVDYDEVVRRLSAGTLRLTAATDLKRNVVITADTAALRRWMATATKDDRLFAEWKTFTIDDRSSIAR